MNTYIFKTQGDFIAWNEEEKNFVTAIYDANEFVCDVLQKDFLYLQDVGFIDRGGNIIPPLSIAQTEMFKDSWGVVIIIEENNEMPPSNGICDETRRFCETVSELSHLLYGSLYLKLQDSFAVDQEIINLSVDFERTHGNDGDFLTAIDDYARECFKKI